MTDPAGTVALFALVTAPMVRPAPVIADCAAACVRPTTFGTVMVAGSVHGHEPERRLAERVADLVAEAVSASGARVGV